MLKDFKAVILFFVGLFVLGTIFAPIDVQMTELLGEHWLPIVFIVGVVIAAGVASQPKNNDQ